jgi:hypothetical protein
MGLLSPDKVGLVFQFRGICLLWAFKVCLGELWKLVCVSLGRRFSAGKCGPGGPGDMRRCRNWTWRWERRVARGSPRDGGCFVCRNLLRAARNANRRTDSGIRPGLRAHSFCLYNRASGWTWFLFILKSQGLQLNALAAGVVLLGGLIAACLGLVFRFSIPAVAGIFSGATTNTPSLAAAQAVLQNLKDQPSANADLLGMAYAVAYPFGIIGIILTMLFIKMVFHIDAETDRIDDRAAKILRIELQITLTWR